MNPSQDELNEEEIKQLVDLASLKKRELVVIIATSDYESTDEWKSLKGVQPELKCISKFFKELGIRTVVMLNWRCKNIRKALRYLDKHGPSFLDRTGLFHFGHGANHGPREKIIDCNGDIYYWQECHELLMKFDRLLVGRHCRAFSSKHNQAGAVNYGDPYMVKTYGKNMAEYHVGHEGMIVSDSDTSLVDALDEALQHLHGQRDLIDLIDVIFRRRQWFCRSPCAGGWWPIQRVNPSYPARKCLRPIDLTVEDMEPTPAVGVQSNADESSSVPDSPRPVTNVSGSLVANNTLPDQTSVHTPSVIDLTQSDAANVPRMEKNRLPSSNCEFDSGYMAQSVPPGSNPPPRQSRPSSAYVENQYVNLAPPRHVPPASASILSSPSPPPAVSHFPSSPGRYQVRNISFPDLNSRRMGVYHNPSIDVTSQRMIPTVGRDLPIRDIQAERRGSLVGGIATPSRRRDPRQRSRSRERRADSFSLPQNAEEEEALVMRYMQNYCENILKSRNIIINEDNASNYYQYVL